MVFLVREMMPATIAAYLCDLYGKEKTTTIQGCAGDGAMLYPL